MQSCYDFQDSLAAVSVFIGLFLLSFVVAKPLHAQDHPGDHAAFGAAKTASHSASNQSSPFSPEQPDQAPDEYFVANSGRGLDTGCTFSSDGDLVIEVDVTRYVGEVGGDGTLLNPNALINAIQVPEYLILQMPAYDVDYGASSSDSNPERDKVYFNGEPIDFLKGSDGQWVRNSFKVDIRDVKFASLGGSAGTNTVRIDIDTANSEDTWCTAIDWVVLGGLQAWRPAVLAHGWNANTTTWETWREKFSQIVPERALPVDARAPLLSLNAAGSVPGNASRITTQVKSIREQIGVEKVNIVAHSKGGLDSRYYAAHRDDVDKLIMLATPNAGSPLGTVCKYATTICQAALSRVTPPGVTGEEVARAAAKYLTPEKVQMQNRTILLNNPNTQYVAKAGDWRFSKYGTGPISVDPGNPLLTGRDDAVVQVKSVYSQGYMTHLNWRVGLLYGTHFGIYRADDVFEEVYSSYLEPPFLFRPAPVRPFSKQSNLVASAASDATTQFATSGPTQTNSFSSARALRERAFQVPQMLDIFEGKVSQGETQTHPLRVDAADTLTVQMYWTAGQVGLEMVTPNGEVIDPSSAQNTPSVEYYDPDEGPSVRGYRVSEPQTGAWTLRAIGDDVPADSVSYAIQTGLKGSAIALSASTKEEFYRSGEQITVEAKLQESNSVLSSASVQARVVRPDSSIAQLTLLDDGANGDGADGDGVYAATLDGTAPAGWYDFFVTAEGTSGTSFSRKAFTQVPVSSSNSGFTGSIEESTSDADDDGLTDELDIEVGVRIDEAGKYFLGGRLTGTDGSFIGSRGVDTTLSAGTHVLDLSFSGRRIYESGLDGPYQLEQLSLTETSSETLPVAILENAYQTSDYTYENFERPSVYPTGEIDDAGVDTDGDGRFDYLDVEVEFEFATSGAYEWTVALADSSREEIETVGGSSYFESGRQTLRFRFDGEKIGEAGVDGPYYVQDILLYRRGGGASLSAFNVARTGSYSACDFEGGVCDTTPPEVALEETATLWPPNHKYVSFSIEDMVEDVTDDYAGSISVDSVRIASASSDEPENGRGDGNTTADIVIAEGGRSIQLRRERSGPRNGRVYTVNLSVSDPNGNVAEAAYRVEVPKSKKRGAVDDGPAYTVEGPGASAAVAATQGAGGTNLPEVFALEAPYPNPTGGRATLPLKLPEGASVRVEAFDISGRRVKTIANEQMSAGRHPLSFKTRNLASGLYLVRTVVETASGQRKVFTTKVTAVK